MTSNINMKFNDIVRAALALQNLIIAAESDIQRFGDFYLDDELAEKEEKIELARKSFSILCKLFSQEQGDVAKAALAVKKSYSTNNSASGCAVESK